MWTPTSEEEILNACANSFLEETSTFDAKREIPSKNSELAKDVSAFANTSGGTIVFGIGEDENHRPTVPSPFELKGQRERIDGVIRTSISEVPDYRINQIESLGDASKGYLVLTIPPSERAPHMVIVKGDRRFYGRGETGNYVLSESEVARLYERRESSKTSLIPLIEQRIHDCPIKDHKGFAHLHAFIKPVIKLDDLLETASGDERSSTQMLNTVLGEIIQSNTFRKQYHPDFNITSNWIRQTDGYLNNIWKTTPGNNEVPALLIEANFDGSGYLFCGRAAETTRERTHQVKWFLSDLVAGNTFKFLDFFRRIYDRAAYFGMVDVGVGVTGLEKSVAIETRNYITGITFHYDKPRYVRTIRVSAMQLQDNCEDVASRLVMPLISAISQDRHDPFE